MQKNLQLYMLLYTVKFLDHNIFCMGMGGLEVDELLGERTKGFGPMFWAPFLPDELHSRSTTGRELPQDRVQQLESGQHVR